MVKKKKKSGRPSNGQKVMTEYKSACEKRLASADKEIMDVIKKYEMTSEEFENVPSSPNW